LTLHLGSDAHKGLTKPIRWMLRGSCRQRCRVHFAHNLLQRDPKAYQGMITAALLSVFAQEKASRSRLPKRRGDQMPGGRGAAGAERALAAGGWRMVSAESALTTKRNRQKPAKPRKLEQQTFRRNQQASTNPNG
jgi:hypothetical protein